MEWEKKSFINKIMEFECVGASYAIELTIISPKP